MNAAPHGRLRHFREHGFTPAVFHKVCVAALVFVAAIIVTGAAVRLTGSGLGCTDWPTCNDSKLIDVSDKHSAIEQINRLFTFVVGLAVVLAALGSWFRRPRRRDLTVLSMLLVAGIPAQAMIGAMVIWTDLHPASVQLHMVASLALVAVAVLLVVRSQQPDRGRRMPAVSAQIRRQVRAVTVSTALALLAGTVATGTGPHAGDDEARRFFGTTTEISGTALTWVTRVHAGIVWVTLALALRLMWSLRRRERDRQRLDGPLSAWLLVGALQGILGYWQYNTGIPAGLVAAHVAGATTLWGITVWMFASTTAVVEDAGSLVDQVIDDARSASDRG